MLNLFRARYLVKYGEIKARLATLEEESIIKKVTGGLLAEYGFKNEYDVMRFHNDKEFYDDLKPLLEQQGFYQCYKVYRIGFTDAWLPRCNEYIDSLESVTSAKLDINKKSYDDLATKFELLANGGNDADITIDFAKEAKSYDEHFAILSDIQELIDLTIPLIN